MCNWVADMEYWSFYNPKKAHQKVKRYSRERTVLAGQHFWSPWPLMVMSWPTFFESDISLLWSPLSAVGTQARHRTSTDS